MTEEENRGRGGGGREEATEQGGRGHVCTCQYCRVCINQGGMLLNLMAVTAASTNTKMRKTFSITRKYHLFSFLVKALFNSWACTAFRRRRSSDEPGCSYNTCRRPRGLETLLPNDKGMNE